MSAARFGSSDSKRYHPKNVPADHDYNPTRERNFENNPQNDRGSDRYSPSDHPKEQLSVRPRSPDSKYNTETEDHDPMLSDDETPLVEDPKHDATRHPEAVTRHSPGHHPGKYVQGEPGHYPEHRRGNQWNYVSWAVIVALFAILILITYLNYNEGQQVGSIIDALAATCETKEPERMGKCFKELLSNRANSGTFQQYHLDELKKKVKKLEASLRYPTPDSGEFRELSERLDEVIEQQKETTSLLEKTTTDVSSLRTELTELDQRMNEINELKTTANEKQLQADHDRLRNEVNEVKKRMDKQGNTVSGLQSSLDILRKDHNNATVWMDRQDNTLSGLKSSLDTLSGDHNNVMVWIAVIEKGVHGLTENHKNVTEWTAKVETGLYDLTRNQSNATEWTAHVERNTSNWIAAFESNTSHWVGSLDYRESSLENFVEFSKHQTRETYVELFSKVRYQSLLLLLVLVAYVWMLALTMCVKQKSAARSSLYYPESRDQLSSSQPYRSREAAPRPTTDVCVVGFYTETSRTHLKSVRDICTASATRMQVRVEVTGFTVHRHEDLSSIPHAKVYMMFVDFNERNVILEDPRKGLGDLRLLTVRTLWDLRGDVILVYAGDVGSKGLEGNDLYNYGLTSINHHTELSKLKNQQRMLSVHKTFSPYQRNHIKDIVTAKCV